MSRWVVGRHSDNWLASWFDASYAAWICLRALIVASLMKVSYRCIEVEDSAVRTNELHAETVGQPEEVVCESQTARMEKVKHLLL